MSQSLPPGIEGQEIGPNPLELFYERYKRAIYAFAALLVLAFGGYYVTQYMKRLEVDEAWQRFTQNTGLQLGQSDVLAIPAGLEQFAQQLLPQLIQTRRIGLTSKLMDSILQPSPTELDQMIAEAQGQPMEPWLIWVAAARGYAERDWSRARAHLQDLKSRFGDHYLCAATDYPPQVREEKETEDKDEEEDPAKVEAPELEPAIRGSLVDNLLADLEANEAFELEHPEFFIAPSPDLSETVVIKLADVGEIEIAFYPTAAPRHVEEFKKNFSTGYYDGMRIHKITRQPEEDALFSSAAIAAPRTAHLGHPNSKDETRELWIEDVEAEEEDILDFESELENLSFFPYMVAAEQEEDGERSSARRFFITSNDCAAQYDGSYVIFARVIRGMDLLEVIIDGDMLDEDEDTQGSGRPSRELLVDGTDLIKK